MNVDTAVEAARQPHPAPALVEVDQAARYFDVSPPFLSRLLARAPRTILKAVDGVSFDILRGETLGLVGESGCGKSTMARLLVGLYRLTRGSIRIEGQPVEILATPQGRALRRRVQMIFQDPYASLNPQWRVGRIIAEPLTLHGVEIASDSSGHGASENRRVYDAARIREHVDELLNQVGLSTADRSKYPHQFSGGQRQRISIARALATQPDFLVCDEPTSALDVSVQAQVLNLMKDLQEKLGLTYLFISHNLAVVRHVADRVGVMYCGRIVELAPRAHVFAMPRHPYTRMLLDAIPDLEMTGKSRVPVAGEVPNPLNPPSGCSFHPRCPHANERCRHEIPELKGFGMDFSVVACHAVEERRI